MAEAAGTAEDDPDLQAVVAGCTASHQRLLVTLDQLDDETARRPSQLPGWTIAHVVTHLARNAESHVRILQGALVGRSVEQYPGGYEQREADIDAGAGRPAAELVEDVRATARELEKTWARMTARAWDGHGLGRGRPWPCRELPFHRWREVELHHVDLGLGYGYVDWPEEYVIRELPRALATLPSRLTDGTARRQLVAWLVGRAKDPGRMEIDDWDSRQEHYFATNALPLTES